MIVLDENIFESQRLELLAHRIRLRQIGYDLGRKGMQDDEIIPLLRRCRRASFFSRDGDLFRKRLCSASYCVVYLDIPPLEVASYARRLLRHPEFKTWSQRKGCVIRISARAVSVWRAHAARPARYRWPDRG